MLHTGWPWHRLYFNPEPQGHASFLLTLTGVTAPETGADFSRSRASRSLRRSSALRSRFSRSSNSRSRMSSRSARSSSADWRSNTRSGASSTTVASSWPMRTAMACPIVSPGPRSSGARSTTPHPTPAPSPPAPRRSGPTRQTLDGRPLPACHDPRPLLILHG